MLYNIPVSIILINIIILLFKKILIIIFLIFTASFTPIAAKYTVREISPVSLAFLRFSLALILFLIVFKKQKLTFSLDKDELIFFTLLGVLVIPVNQLCFLNGIKLSFASHSGVIYACTPLFAYLLSIFVKHIRFSFHTIIPIFLSILGIFIIFYENIIKSKFYDSNVLLGDLLLVGAVASWAAYLTLSKKMTSKYGALKTNVISYIIGLILYIPFFLYDIKNLTFTNITTYGIIGFFQLSVVVAFAGYFLITYSSKFMNVVSITTATNLSPIVTIFFSYILLNEEISYFFIAGAFVTIFGVFLSQKKEILNKFI